MGTCHEMFILCHMQYCDITEDSNCKVFINKSVKKNLVKSVIVFFQMSSCLADAIL